MFSKKVVILLLMVVSSAAWAQETVKKVSRPNIPGSFIVDLGVNRALDKPANFSQGLWGSRTVNLYYQYPLRFGKTKFSFNPGVGLSLERFKFTNNRILVNVPETTDPQIDRFDLVAGATYYPNIKKSMLIANYLEIPAEIRFDTRPNDVARSFSVAVGGRIGVLMNGSQKIKYRFEGDDLKIKDKKSHGLNPIRYGLYTRVGIGGFNWFVFYNLSEMFEKDRGPDATIMNTMTFGISINGF